MTFAAIAQLVSGQRPFFLYAFAKGTTEYLFTNRNFDISWTIPGVTGTLWTPSSISHDRVPDATEAFRSEFTIQVPLTDAFARTFLNGLSYQDLRVTVWKGFLNDPDEELAVVYKGTLISITPDSRGVIRMSFMTAVANLQRKGLAAVIQRPCRHALYGRNCGVVRTSFQLTADVDSVISGGSAVTISEAGAEADGYYSGGVIEFGGQLEMILKHVGTRLDFALAIPTLMVGSSVQISPGCNLTQSVCLNRFNNLENFGGFPFIQDTPFDGRSIV